MKKTFSSSILYLLLFFSANLLAGEAVVISFRAPLQKAPESNAKTFQVFRKGEIIYLSDKEIKNPSHPEYYEIFDRSGRTGYIKKEYLKVIYKDDREENESITYVNARTGHDSTDFRLEEPLPATYPFESREFARLNVSLSLGNNPKSPYRYNANVSKQKYSSESGLRLNYQRKLDFDLVDRLYFGVFAAISSVRNQIDFSDGGLAEESRSLIRLGPVLSFDFYKTERHLLTLGTGFTWNLHRSSLKVMVNSFGEEEKLYTGFSLAPFLQSTYAFRDLYPNLDFTLGSELNFFLPHTQKSSSTPEFTQYWNEENPTELNHGLKPQALFFMGLNFKY